MKSKICDKFGIEFPLFAFSHCRDVVAGVSAAGGFGVLGATGHSPETLDVELKWIDEHVDGKPYGVDVLVPASLDSQEEALDPQEIQDRIPPEHKEYVLNLLAQHGIKTEGLYEGPVRSGVGDNYREIGASMVIDAALDTKPTPTVLVAESPKKQRVALQADRVARDAGRGGGAEGIAALDVDKLEAPVRA